MDNCGLLEMVVVVLGGGGGGGGGGGRGGRQGGGGGEMKRAKARAVRVCCGRLLLGRGDAVECQGTGLRRFPTGLGLV